MVDGSWILRNPDGPQTTNLKIPYVRGITPQKRRKKENEEKEKLK